MKKFRDLSTTSRIDCSGSNENSKACDEIAEKLVRKGEESIELNKLKVESCKKFGLNMLPKNSEILLHLDSFQKEKISKEVRIKNVRSISGINVVSVMSTPFECPHGRCAYCPQEENVPNSYTGFEPAAMRGLQNAYDPYKQASSRIAQLRAIGHDASKVELIIQGGTFPATPINYQKQFIKNCIDAITSQNSKNLEDAKRKAETSEVKNVGITFETRPDWAKQDHIDSMLEMGVTRIELGIQTLYDDIYQKIDRGHSVNDVIKSFQIIKDSALKIVAHMMPGLPGSNMKRDLEAFRQLFSDHRFKPDMLKIYPCLVLKGTKVYEWWSQGQYQPYDIEQTVELISRIKEIIPPWVRIMRIQRDIPVGQIIDGVKKGNLREIVQAELKERGLKCRCIRCREVGHKLMKEGLEPDPADIILKTREYKSSNGTELFISFEDTKNDILIGYLRLRIPSEKAHRLEIKNIKSSLIRELHVYGPLIPVGKYKNEGWQHKGYGKKLISEAERISVEKFDREKILAMSALGVKKYFMKFGYRHDGPYMSKILR
ncbi:MAG: tRNA uridine(34) 5-carboxymethylaminomethyl modification radical SAM/GNAT enzyme Elp3 [Candidatus Bathyarchaeota archaeon]|nr:tRNA uridine(34) 5-carboxymethylaminomethyl modification radical SAM/GNAT enzyme Elp3 [Candidatus Bathyarchaeota archaeon]